MIWEIERPYCSCHMNSDACGVHQLHATWDDQDGYYAMFYEAFTVAAKSSGFRAALADKGGYDPDEAVHEYAEDWALKQVDKQNTF